VEQKLKQLALSSGAGAVGISSVDRLGDLPSMDPTYLLPGARSIISIMIPLDDAIIRRYLAKEDREGLQIHETEVYRSLYSISKELAALLESEGYEAAAPEPNLDYRFKDRPGYKRVPYRFKQGAIDWFASKSSGPIKGLKKVLTPIVYEKGFKGVKWSLTPSFSHRYGAIACGIGNMGWSGNVMHPDYGARVLYITMITSAVLQSDPMMEENPCDGCRTCVKSCQSNFMHPKNEDHVIIGGKKFVHNKKAANLRCIMVCAGFSGQNDRKEWSTWSPGRLELPADDADLPAYWEKFVKDNLWQQNHYSKTLADLNYHSEHGHIRKAVERFPTTCGNCQFVCGKTRKVRRESFKLLANSGEVREGPDGKWEVVRPGK
jgi:epoxyqueuosine reductase